MDTSLTVAIPKGKLGGDALDLLREMGLPGENVDTEARSLIHEYPDAGLRYIICRPTDVPTYVEFGAADLGIVGKDTIVEAAADVYELLDLGFGYCRFVVAVEKGYWETLEEQGLAALSSLDHHRVATKFPRVAEEFFRGHGMQVQVIKLHGNIELAPQVGLAEMIVDIVSTGASLRENGLVAVADIFSASARLIANRASMRLKAEGIQRVSGGLRKVVAGRRGRSA